jgi:beta-N-acetylhexosaminidase
MFAADGSDLEVEDAQFAAQGLGGALLQNVGPHLAADDVDALRTAGSIPMMIAVDEEGGEVQRLAPELGPLPSEHVVAASMTPAQAEAMIAAHAHGVAKLGINVVFAPVVDVSPATGNGPMGTRTFGSQADTTIRFARAYVSAWQAAGILPVLKHFPGHGSASGDTHTGTATVPPLSVLRTRDLLPYDALARDRSDLGVMVAHVSVPGFTSGPSSLDPAAYRLLRDDVRFQGVAFTDALNMEAVAQVRSMPVAAVTAIQAGADVALLMDLSEAPATVAALIRAAGTTLPIAQLDASVLRVLKAKRVDPCALKP